MKVNRSDSTIKVGNDNEVDLKNSIAVNKELRKKEEKENKENEKDLTTTRTATTNNANKINTNTDKSIKEKSSINTSFIDGGLHGLGPNAPIFQAHPPPDTPFGSLLLGICLFIASIYITCFNERRAVKTTLFKDILQDPRLVVEVNDADVSIIDRKDLGNKLFVVNGKNNLLKP